MFTDKEKSNIILTILASILAANGLITNSVSGVICSMLVSPYLSVITNIATDLFNMTLIGHNFIVLGSYLGMSFLVGIIYYLIQRNFLGINKLDIEKNKSEMINRADLNIREYSSIFIYAIISGITLGFITGNKNYTESTITIVTVGIGIGVALLPSMVNSGLFIVENNRKYAFQSLLGALVTIIGIIMGIIGFLYFSKNII